MIYGFIKFENGFTILKLNYFCLEYYFQIKKDFLKTEFSMPFIMRCFIQVFLLVLFSELLTVTSEYDFEDEFSKKSSDLTDSRRYFTFPYGKLKLYFFTITFF